MINFFEGGNQEEEATEAYSNNSVEDLQNYLVDLYNETMTKNGINPKTGEQLNTEVDETKDTERLEAQIDTFLNAWGNSLMERDLDNKGKWDK
jgi:hypothetical protein